MKTTTLTAGAASTPTVQHKHSLRYRILKMLQGLGGHALLIGMGLFFFIPFLWMISTSLKSDQDVFRTPPSLLPHDNQYVQVNGKAMPLYEVTQDNVTRKLALENIAEGMGTFYDPANPAQPEQIRMKFAKPLLVVGLRWRNFADAMNRATRTGLGVTFWTYFKNSLIIAFFSIVGTLLSCAPVAYGFARIRWPGRDLVFIFVLATMMLPFQVTMIPMYLFFNDVLHWGDSFLPLIVPTFFANAWDIFLLRQFFRTIPEEMCDAARVDGASEWQIFTRIVLPLSIPVLATITVFTFLWAWNDFTGPLLFLTSPKNFTMAIGLQDFQGQHTVAWNQLMAASVVFTLPIIIAFFFAQKTFIQGIKLTGSKE
jgi:multiple sugar transport system permease protein